MDIPAEPTSALSAKKRCTEESKQRPLESVQKFQRPQECIREFKLPRQFPSTKKQALKSGIRIIETLPSNVKVFNADNLVAYNLQKLRILSPKGRDLGEFNVKLKSDDRSKGNTITITKSNFKPVDKPPTLPLSSVSHRVLPRILKHGTGKILKRHLTEDVSCSRSTSWTDNGNVSCKQQSKILPTNRVLSNNQCTEGKTEKQTHNSSINTGEGLSTNGISSKRSVCQTVDSDNRRYVAHHGTDDTDIRNCTRIPETADGNNEVFLATETQLYKELVRSPCPANCKRLATNSSDKNDTPQSGRGPKVSKGKCIYATVKNTENGRKIVMSLKSASLAQRYSQIDKNSSHDGLHNSSGTNFNCGEVSYDKDNSLQTDNESDVVSKNEEPEVKTRNVMTFIPNNKTLLSNQNAVLAQASDTTTASIRNMINVTSDLDTVGHDTQCDDMQIEGSWAGSQDDHLIVDGHVRHIPETQQITGIVQKNVQNENLPEEDLSDRLSIIKKAMDSVKDNKLRELALKALADCGIGIERYVPIRPPEDHKAVHDTQVQTVVFGLLEPKSFILINKDLEDIHRLSQITFRDMPGDENLSADNPHSNNNFVSKDNFVSNCNASEQESHFDLDSFMEQFWKEDSDALKMKEILSMTRVRCNGLLENLQRDFECVKQYDRNGMLNIHNAVISDNVYHVRRQLLVLEHCKQSVDILTEDGATSLELAIKYDVSSEIVELLLDAGARPVISRSIHESALIIASKQSSPLLSMLVSRVSDSKLLDKIDSEGLAALHYCSIHGNLEGVKALVSAGATIDLKDMKSGRTALFHAIDNGHTSMMQMLLKVGAVANVENYAGQTAISVLTDPKSMSFKMSSKKDVT